MFPERSHRWSSHISPPGPSSENCSAASSCHGTFSTRAQTQFESKLRRPDADTDLLLSDLPPPQLSLPPSHMQMATRGSHPPPHLQRDHCPPGKTAVWSELGVCSLSQGDCSPEPPVSVCFHLYPGQCLPFCPPTPNSEYPGYQRIHRMGHLWIEANHSTPHPTTGPNPKSFP